ncbi:methoprene-tolerant isoform X1 [Leptinotarsa decemlineata]|uniref:Methoprene tolerant protein n=1 Tax=Leptinotarsa decemlineata TaxID=7539 RepID=A0A0F7II76_LEPDE|nr:neuronal PAS domain-containing protein 2-like isoform X1 [Leptinotarsa decemlineata]AKG92748.1 methoprene tolerant protein [Leptinotarsa decemlineata]
MLRRKIGDRVPDAMSNQWLSPPRPSYGLLMDTPPSNSREQRNRAEKQRRDKLNAYIAELARLVPMVSRSSKRMDKTSILRLTATYMRINQTLMQSKDGQSMQFPKHVDQYILEQLVCEQMGGFLLVLLSTGKIVFISHTVENLLGHLQTDLMGQSIFNITSPEDHERLRTYLQCEGDVDREWKKYFSVRLKRAGPRSESAVYEPVRMMGMHKPAGYPELNHNSPSSSSSSSSSSTSSGLNNSIMVLFVKICQPEPLVELLIEASKEEYMTRHLIDGRIIGCDQRISTVAGYMIDEVTGDSAFKYMHRDDVRWVIIALRQMYDRGESRGSSCYRLQSRNGQFIFLKTYGFLEIDEQGTVESFVCVNTLVTQREGMQLIDDMKKKYSAIINSPTEEEEALVPSSNGSIDLVEDPEQVDQAVAQLMSNLPSPGSEYCSTPSPQVHYENQDCTTSLTDNSPNRHQVKFKTVAPKRPNCTDTQFNGFNKRKKTTPPPLMSPVHRAIAQMSPVSPLNVKVNHPEGISVTAFKNLKTQT